MKGNNTDERRDEQPTNQPTDSRGATVAETPGDDRRDGRALEGADDQDGVDPENDPDPADPSTWEGDRPPEDAIASREDFEVERDGDGELVPQWERVPGTQKWVKVVPARQGDADRYLPDSGNPGDMTDRQIVEVLNQFYVEPSWDLDPRHATQEIEDIKAFGVDPLIMAWYNASGFDYQMGMVSDNAEVIQAVEGNTQSGS